MLRLAIQKKGRLSDETIQLLKRCDLQFSKNATLISKVENFPMEILFLRDDDIPECVADGVADIGIVGENEVYEKQRNVITQIPLGFAKCRMAIAVPKLFPYQSILDLSGKRIATSYPKILHQFLKQRGIVAEIHEISGSVEIAPNIGLSEAIFDIVSSGSTLRSNGLTEVETVLNSEAVLISQPDLSYEKQQIIKKLCFRIEAVQAAHKNRYVLMNIPTKSIEHIVALVPGMKSPTILPLAEPEWSSLHTVVNIDMFWNVIEQVKKLGAQGILVTEIEKMVR